MKRVTHLLLTAIFILFSCEETDIAPTLDSFRLSKILNYSRATSSQPYGFVKFDHDNRGNLIKETTFDYPNTLTTYKVYEYANNKITNKKIYDGQVGTLTLGTYINYYYTDAKLTKEELYRSDGSLQYATYNEFNGNILITTYKVNDNLGVHDQFKYTYDNKNRLILERVFMYNQELDEFTKYVYDEDDRLIKTERYDKEGVITSFTEKVYQESDNLPDEELSYDSNGQLVQRKELAYDSWGNLIGCTSEGQSSCRLFSKKYNGQLLMEEIRYHPYFGCDEWTVTRYEYEPK